MTTAALPHDIEKRIATGMPMLDAIFLEIEAGYPVPELDQDGIDEIISDYQLAQAEFEKIKSGFDDRKKTLIRVVQAYGSVPAHAEQSKRLSGRRNVATVTTGTTMNVNEDAVAELKSYLGDLDSGIFERMFSVNIKHQMIDGARNVLAALQLPKRTHDKVLSLFGRCIDPKPKAASLKIEVSKPEKPAKKARGSKAAA